MRGREIIKFIVMLAAEVSIIRDNRVEGFRGFGRVFCAESDGNFIRVVNHAVFAKSNRRIRWVLDRNFLIADFEDNVVIDLDKSVGDLRVDKTQGIVRRIVEDKFVAALIFVAESVCAWATDELIITFVADCNVAPFLEPSKIA